MFATNAEFNGEFYEVYRKQILILELNIQSYVGVI